MGLVHSVDVAIIGGGIAGLTLAYRLRQVGAKVCVLEANDSPGGVIHSGRHQGYLLEWGPNTVLTKPAVRQLIAELGLESEVIPQSPEAKNRFLGTTRNGSRVLIPFPHSPFQVIASSLLSARSKVRLLGEPFAKQNAVVDTNLADFLSARLGKDVTNDVVAAFFAGIWAADINSLSAQCAVPSLWEWVKSSGSIYRGAVRHLFFGAKGPRSKSQILSFRNGLSTLTHSIAAKLGESILLNRSVSRVEIDGPERFRVEFVDQRANCTQSISAQKVVTAIDALGTAALLEPFDQTLSRTLRKIPYASIGILHLSIPRESLAHPLDGFGFLSRPQKGKYVLGAIFNSSLFPSTAPPGQVLLTVFCGGAVNPEGACVDDSAVRGKSLAELSEYLSPSTNFSVLSATQIQRAIPNYPVGHQHTVDAIASFTAKVPGLFIMGNWLRGISVGDRIVQATSLAEEISAQISRPHSQQDHLEK